MCQPLPYDEIKFDRNVKLEDKIITLDDCDIGFFVEGDLNYPDEIKEQTRIISFCRENEISSQHTFSDYEIEMKPNFNTQVMKLK